MDEMIKHFNDVVSAMSISIKDKMTILDLITAIGYKYQDDCKTYQDIIETDRDEIQWLKKCVNDLPAADVRPVVLCRDCTFFKPQQKSARWSSTTPMCSRSATIKMPPDGFCSFGVKRDES